MVGEITSEHPSILMEGRGKGEFGSTTLPPCTPGHLGHLREAKLSLVSPARPGYTGKGLLRAATRLGSTELPELLRKMKQREDSYYDPSVGLASFPIATWFQRREIPLNQRLALSLQD